MNGDGRPDFAVGAPGADPGGRRGRRLGVRRHRRGDSAAASAASAAAAASTPASASSSAALTQAEAEAEAQAEEVQEGLPPRARQVQEEAEVADLSAAERLPLTQPEPNSELGRGGCAADLPSTIAITARLSSSGMM